VLVAFEHIAARLFEATQRKATITLQTP